MAEVLRTDDGVLLCPVCQGRHVHFTTAYGTSDSPRHVGTVGVTIPGMVPPLGMVFSEDDSRPTFALKGFCEEGGHHFLINFINSKGNTMVVVTELTARVV